MCGWAGLWSASGEGAAVNHERIRQMAQTLVHRGPDDGDYYVDAQGDLALGFRRLAIVDLSPEGRQPMHSESGRYVISFNGEVYNFAELRRDLEPAGHRFRGHSDTEVMLAAIEQWGLEASVKRFVGMFAFALWDRRLRRLSLVRDRLGIKPLYYGWMGQTFLCGSELKALRAHPDFQADIDRGALCLFLRHNYVPGPQSIYRGIHHLPPGHILTIAGPDKERPAPVAYWSAREVAERGIANPFTGTPQEAVNELERVLGEAVALRMIADVPLGAFLSGGVDSSTVVALMQQRSAQPVKTFSIGNHENGYDEAVHAKAVAKHLGTDHTELYVSDADAQAVIPKLADMYDEPFADSSQVPTYLVSELTRRRVTVSLSGDGGDELFGGYTRYLHANRIWKKLRWLPAHVRRMLASSITAVGPGAYDRWLGWLARYTSRFGLSAPIGGKLHKLAESISVRSPEALYRRLVSHWESPAELVIGGQEPPTLLTEPERWAKVPDFTSRMMFLDTVTYLPDDILTKVDRASMAVSLEARVPLLDHRVVEFAWRLPLNLKLRGGVGKWVLRQVLDKFVPRHLIERPKMGFGIPIETWLRGGLRDWAEALLDENRLRNEGFFKPQPIRQYWAEHLSGRRNRQYLLWDVLMFQAWLERWGGAPSAALNDMSSAAMARAG